jgi:hypothetical protein
MRRQLSIQLNVERSAGVGRRAAGFAIRCDLCGGRSLCQPRAYFEPVPGGTLPPVSRGAGTIIDKPEHEAFEALDALKGTAAERDCGSENVLLAIIVDFGCCAAVVGRPLFLPVRRR